MGLLWEIVLLRIFNFKDVFRKRNIIGRNIKFI